MPRFFFVRTITKLTTKREEQWTQPNMLACFKSLMHGPRDRSALPTFWRNTERERGRGRMSHQQMLPVVLVWMLAACTANDWSKPLLFCLWKGSKALLPLLVWFKRRILCSQSPALCARTLYIVSASVFQSDICPAVYAIWRKKSGGRHFVVVDQSR